MQKNVNKKISQKEVLELIHEVVKVQKSMFDADLTGRIINIISTLQKYIYGLSFFVNVLLLRVFLGDLLVGSLRGLFTNWGELSEAWQIGITFFILSIPASIFSGLIVSKFSSDTKNAR